MSENNIEVLSVEETNKEMKVAEFISSNSNTDDFDRSMFNELQLAVIDNCINNEEVEIANLLKQGPFSAISMQKIIYAIDMVRHGYPLRLNEIINPSNNTPIIDCLIRRQYEEYLQSQDKPNTL